MRDTAFLCEVFGNRPNARRFNLQPFVLRSERRCRTFKQDEKVIVFFQDCRSLFNVPFGVYVERSAFRFKIHIDALELCKRLCFRYLNFLFPFRLFRRRFLYCQRCFLFCFYRCFKAFYRLCTFLRLVLRCLLFSRVSIDSAGIHSHCKLKRRKRNNTGLLHHKVYRNLSFHFDAAFQYCRSDRYAGCEHCFRSRSCIRFIG